MCKVHKANSTGKSREVGGGRDRGLRGQGGGARRSLRALEIVIGGWVFENEGGCRCCQCRVCEKNCSSGDEGGGGGAAQKCKGVAGFGSGEVGEGGLSSLERPPPSIPTTTRRHLEL